MSTRGLTDHSVHREHVLEAERYALRDQVAELTRELRITRGMALLFGRLADTARAQRDEALLINALHKAGYGEVTICDQPLYPLPPSGDTPVLDQWIEGPG